MSLLAAVEVETGPAPSAAVLWLHGLGADGHDFEPIVPMLRGAGEPAVRFVFPHAPVRPVTINGGLRMRAWYDIKGLDLAQRVDAEGIRASADQVAALLAREGERGIPTERVVLAGFSQGGAVALYLGLRLASALAGLVALSTYLPLADELGAGRHPANGGTPVFMGHGTADPVVPLALGEACAQQLERWGQPVSWHRYPMQHAVCPAEIADLRAFLTSRLPA